MGPSALCHAAHFLAEQSWQPLQLLHPAGPEELFESLGGWCVCVWWIRHQAPEKLSFESLGGCRGWLGHAVIDRAASEPSSIVGVLVLGLSSIVGVLVLVFPA